MPTISVIIPTWNRARTLRRAIDSALSQTVEPLEVLVCDDGSTDESRAVVAAIDDERVHWLEGAHEGRPAIPRNRGLARSRGDWVAFLDSDDCWLPGKLSAQLGLAARLGCHAACGNALRYVPSLGVSDDMRLQASERVSFRQLLRTNLVVCSSAMFKRELLAKVHGFPEQPELRAVEDYALWLRVATHSQFAFVSSPCVSYTDAPASSIRGHAPSDGDTQRRQVFADYLSWASPWNPHALALQLERARAALRRARERRRSTG